MEKLYIKNIVKIFDIMFNIFILGYFIHYLIPLFYSLLGLIVDRNIFNMYSINVFGILFVIMLIKLFIGIIINIIYLFKYKIKLIKDKYINYVWFLFSILILSIATVLIINRSYNSIYNLFYSIYVIIGTYSWLNIMLFKNNIHKIIRHIFVFLNIISNYLLIIIGYMISIY